MAGRNKIKKQNINKDILAAIGKVNREEEIRLHGKPIAFRTHIQESKKKYKRSKKVVLPDDL